jgi:hypothetical protein
MRTIAMGFMVAMALSAGSALAYDVVIPPMPDSWKSHGDRWSWERAVRRCAERPTKWARERCIRGLYE